MKKYLFIVTAFLPLVAQSAYLEAVIPNELANEYMNRAIEVFEKNPQSDVRLSELNGVQTLRFLDIGGNHKSEQVCVRKLESKNATCVIRDYNELGGSLNSDSATLRRLSGILWDLLPGKPSHGMFGTKVYKNLSCTATTFGTGYCIVSGAKLK